MLFLSISNFPPTSFFWKLLKIPKKYIRLQTTFLQNDSNKMYYLAAEQTQLRHSLPSTGYIVTVARSL